MIEDLLFSLLGTAGIMGISLGVTWLVIRLDRRSRP